MDTHRRVTSRLPGRASKAGIYPRQSAEGDPAMNAPRHSSLVWNQRTLRALFVVPLLVASVVVAACSQDPLPTHTPFPTYTPFPTFTPIPTPTPTPEPTPTPTSPPIPPPDPNAPVVYRLERIDFSNQDGVPGFVIRMGATY